MASIWGFLNTLMSGGDMHDYAHAAQVFRTSNFSRSPKYKFLFYVNFILGQGVPRHVSTREIGYLVKSVELPKFTMDVKDLNQYNKHTYIQDRIKYEPVSIKFHDDNQNGLRELWQDYYNYYYADGLYGLNDYNYDDRYQQRLHSAWGLDNGSLTPFFSAIEIYSMQSGQANKITLMSPVITSFQHDTHDYAASDGLMEATMQVRYNGVTYEGGYVQDMPGFNESAYYDETLSPLSGAFGRTNFINPVTGQLEQQGNQFTNRGQYYQQQQGSYGFVDQGSYLNQTANQGFSPEEISTIIQNNDLNQTNASTEFPLADTNAKPIATAVPLPPPRPSDIDTNTQSIDATSSAVPTNPFQTNSWQTTLWNQGYSAEQVNNAANFIATVPTATLASYGGFSSTETAKAVIAQQYIDDPNSVASIGDVNYGQPNSVPSSISFADPTSPPSAVYNSDDWIQTLKLQGYTDSDITLASNHISKINVPPGFNLVPLAKNYIQNSKITTTTNQ
jgi:hypothetical protein